MINNHHNPTPRERRYQLLVGMLERCREALRISTEMESQEMVGLLFEQEKKLTAMVEAARP